MVLLTRVCIVALLMGIIFFGIVLLEAQSPGEVLVREADSVKSITISDFLELDFNPFADRSTVQLDVATLAALASNVYEPDSFYETCNLVSNGEVKVEGWTKWTDWPAPKSCNEELSDLYYEVWGRMEYSDEFEMAYIAIVFRGTIPTIAHWCANLRDLELPLCDPRADQYLHVAPLVDEILRNVKSWLGPGLDFYPIAVGHSLGGGLAELAGRSSYIKQVFTFDSSPVTAKEISSKLRGAEHDWEIYEKLDSEYKNLTGCEMVRDDHAEESHIRRIFEHGEVLAFLRYLKRWFIGQPEEPPFIEYRTNILGGGPIAQHSIKALACELRAWAERQEDSAYSGSHIPGIEKRVASDHQYQIPRVGRSYKDPSAPDTRSDLSPSLIAKTGHLGAVNAVTFSPDGKYILTGSDDRTAVLWEVETGREVRRFSGHLDWVSSVAFCPDGTCVLTGSWDDTARLWNVETGEELLRYTRPRSFGDGVNSVAISIDMNFILTGHRDGIARLWNLKSGEMVREFSIRSENPNPWDGKWEPADEITVVAFSPGGKHVITGSNYASAALWETLTGKHLHEFWWDSSGDAVIAFSPDGKYLVSGDSRNDNPTARLWDTEHYKELKKFEGHESGIRSVIFSPSGDHILTGSENAILWDLAGSGKEVQRFGVGSQVNAVAYSPNATQIATAHQNGSTWIWDVASGEKITELGSLGSEVSAAALSPDGKRILVVSVGRTARLWSTDASEPVQTLEGISSGRQAVTFSSDGKLALMALSDGTVGLTSMSFEEDMIHFKGHEGVENSVAMSPDGRRFVTLGDDQTIRIWHTKNGEELQRLCCGVDDLCNEANPLCESVELAKFSPDGRFVLSAGQFAPALLWEIATGEVVRKFQWSYGEYEEGVHDAAISPDGKSILTGSEEGIPRLWDLETGKELVKYEGHESVTLVVAFSQDGKRVLTGSADNTARVWSTITGKELIRFKGHQGPVTSVAFYQDSSRVVTGSSDGTTRVWDTATGKELARLISFKDGTWAVIGSDRRFDVSNSSDIKGLHWSLGLKSFPLTKFKAEYYSPGLFSEILDSSGER